MVASFTRQLCSKHYAELTGKRKLPADWVLANCQSTTLEQASELLGYTAKSSGMLLQGVGWQQQFKPDIPWASESEKDAGKRTKKPKYRTPKQPEGTNGYDAMLPMHPEDKTYWHDLEALKKRCWQIDGHPFLLVTEGHFKAIMGCAHGLPTISLLGVENGLTSAKDDPQGKRYLVPALERLTKAGFGFIFAFDADAINKLAVKEAERKLTHQIKKFKVPVLSITGTWAEEQGKGMDDFIANQGIEAFREKLCQAYEFSSSQESGSKEKQKLPPADIVAAQIAEDHRDKLAYNNETGRWMRYEGKFPGVWSTESNDFMESMISTILDSQGITGYGGNSYIVNILKKLQHKLFQYEWLERPANELIPYQNGVLEIATGKLLEHSPGYRFTWSIPRPHNLLASNWQKIDDYLDALSQGNRNIKEIFLCFANAVLKGRSDLQKFLHLIGLAGSGKGTYGRLICDLLGEENIFSTTLDDWCNNRFESSNAYRKRLIVFWDEDKQSGKLGKFLSLTGGDWIRGEAKQQKAFQFKYDGMVLLMSNIPIFTGSSVSRVARRAITVPCNHQTPKGQIRDLNSEFQNELDAFTNYVLSIPDERVTRCLKGLAEVPECTSEFWENRMRTDAIAAWLNEHVVQDATAQTPIGMNRDEGLDHKPETLYGSYTLFCKQAGMNAKSHVNFSPDLIELCTTLLGWQVSKVHTMKGKSISGLRLRTNYDSHIPTHDYGLKLRIENQQIEVSANDGLDDGLDDGLKPIQGKVFEEDDGLKPIYLKNEEEKLATSDDLVVNVSEEMTVEQSSLPEPLSNKEFESSLEPSFKPSLPFDNDSDYDDYPHLVSKDPRAQRGEAEKIRQLLLAVTTKEELLAIQNLWSTRYDWVWGRMSPKERNKVDAVTKVEQLNLLDVKPQPKVEEEPQSQSPVPSPQSPVEDEWLEEEELKNMAIALDSCESKEALALLRQCWPPHALNKACKLLTPEKHEQIKRWVIEQQTN